VTGRGYGLVLFALATYLAGRLLGTEELYLVALALVAMIVITQVLALLARGALTVDRTLDPTVPVAHEPLQIHLRVANRGLLPVMPSELTMSLAGAADIELSSSLGAIGPRRTSRFSVPVPGLLRGIYTLPAPSVATEDPLGIARRTRSPGRETAMTVLPAHVILGSCVFFGGKNRGQDPRTRATSAHSTYDLRGVRPHQPGEPLSRIDWKSTAKTGILMLRETEEHTRSAVILLLDGTEAAVAGRRGDDTFELAVSALASVGIHALRTGLSLKLILHADHPGEVFADPGERGERVLLTGLAKAEPDARRPLSMTIETFASSVAGGISLVVATSNVDRALLTDLSSLRERGTPSYVVHVDSGAYRREHDVIAQERRSVLHELSLRGIPSVTLRSADDLEPALSLSPEIERRWQGLRP